MLMNPVLAPLLFNIFINDVAECTLSKVVNDIKLGGVADVRVGGLCCHPEGSQQSEKYTQDSHEVQQGEVKNSALGEELLQVAIYIGGLYSWKAGWLKKSWGSQWTLGWIRARNVLLLQRK